MWNLYLLAVGGLALIESFTAGLTFSLANDHDYVPRTRRSVNTQTQRELASFICSNSTILGPTSTDWVDETERYMQNVIPQVELSVRPGCEDDVAKIVQYANVHDIPFYAVSRGHALTTSVGLFKGIEIDLSNLKSIHINSGNITAHFQGGVYGDEVINALWEQGFVTGTGGCDCVSILGPGLGGGHGLQQGQHGLTSDHLVNLNVVLANGTAVQVNASSHPDLWWAMRGAGHNFGIVTSFDSKIWVNDFKTYFVKSYQFSGHVLDSLIDQVNEFQGNGTLNPAWLASFGLYFMNTTISQTEATISWTFLYDGPQAEAELQLQPFNNLGPLSVSELSVPYNVINNQIGGAINGSLCEPNKTHVIGTANLQVFNVTAMRAIYELYNQKINQHPELSDTRVLVEGYAVKGVQSFASNDSAYPFRDENILTYFDVRLNSSNDPLIDFAVEWRNQTVALWNAGQPNRKPSAYVNYAAGYESLEERYGYEPWRLQKLRELKVQYDPQNKFAWYNPIIPPE